MKTVAVVPVFDHGESAGAVVHALRGRGLPVILVDDGSGEATAKKLAALAGENADDPAVTLVTHAKNLGKGAAVMTGLRAAFACGASHALQADADGQHDLDAVPRFLEAAARHPAAVIAACPRYDESVPRLRLHARYLTHVWVWINTLSRRIDDSMCGLRVYPLAAVLPLLPVLARARRMEFDPEILVRLDWAGVEIVNMPVAVRYPAGNASRFRPWRDNARIAAMHARLFFGMIPRLPRLFMRHFRRGGR
ncbi:MAG: glycosyltransferase family 2 protein [Candidatus Accumulibacter sp.]|jgi:glycosyltransferase involved in cell wall biosynthesis|nr:glycosyltransferase family 2 protein [Accumulibacter sp.]